MASHDQTSAPSGEQTNNVSIRLIALAHSTNANEDMNLTVNLGTTVTELKQQLQQQLSQHPRPESQRLIYQGRPLTDGNATLRQILRLEPGTTGEAPVHVLYLVVRDDQPANPSNAGRPQLPQNPVPTTNAASNPQARSNQLPMSFDFAQHAFPQGHPAQALLQNAMQHHLAIQNHHRQHQQQHQQHVAGTQHTTATSPTLQGLQSPQTSGSGDQAPHINSEPANVPSSPPAPESNTATGNSTGTDPVVSHSHSTTFMSVEETIGPNGERTRRVIHNGPQLPAQSPVERSASAPGVPGRPAGSFIPARSGLLNPVLPHGLPRVQLPHIPGFQQPFGRLPTGTIGHHNFGQAQYTHPARDPLLYLISSTTGPEALLFTPNHGYFTSQQTSSANNSMSQTQSQSNDGPRPSNQSATTQPTPADTVARNNQQNQVVLRPQAAARGHAVAQPGRREGEDVIAQVFQRGWLFLRLYMFIFVLSEPGTWRRYILLLIASLVCLLPRNNPFTDLFQAARRHFDNLIGPPQPPARPQRQQTQEQQPGGTNARDEAVDNDTGTSGNQARHRTTDARMPTPEEHARRLLQEREARNPNTIRDALYRIEQAVAMFLASLIPGVGERHIRAREEARRLVQEEAERQRREEEERRQQDVERRNIKSDETPAPSSTVSLTTKDQSSVTSTGVDGVLSQTTTTGNADEGLRARNGDPVTQSS